MSISSPRSVAPLHLEPRPSRLLRGLILAFHLGGIALSLSLSVAAPWHVALPLLLCGSCLHALRRAAAPPVLLWDGDGEWHLLVPEAEEALALLPESFVAPWLVVLNFRRTADGRRLSVPLLPDSLVAGELRRLRAALRLRAFRPEPQSSGR